MSHAPPATPSAVGRRDSGAVETAADGTPAMREFMMFGPPPVPSVDNGISTAKYSVLSFLPKNLMEQFRRVANMYFLLISILMYIGTYYRTVFDSPLTPFSTLGPLIIVLAITMAKEGYEDSKRHLSDREVNNRFASVVRGKGVEDHKVRWQDLRVGDVVRVNGGDPFPADMVLLFSSKPDGGCFIETSNIDGETDLKAKEPIDLLAAALRSAEHRSEHEPLNPTPAQVQYLGNLEAKITCQMPNSVLYGFEGRLDVHKEAGTRPGGVTSTPVGSHSLGYGNVLLRGCTLRNTHWVYGLVVYTGRETKVMMKAGHGPAKMSEVEKTVNRSMSVIFGSQFVMCVVTVILALAWDAANNDTLPYLLLPSGSQYLLPQWLGNFFTFLILFNNFIPISLYVTVEMVNYLQAMLVNTDQKMYDPETDTPAKARTSNLNQDLGQIEYIFSDKTGTLTRNVMEFKACTILGIPSFFGSLPNDDAEDGDENEGAGAAGGPAAAGAAGAAGAASPRPAALPPKKLGKHGDAFQDPNLMAVMRGERGVDAFARVDALLTILSVCHTVVPEEVNARGTPMPSPTSPTVTASGAASPMPSTTPSAHPNSITGKEIVFQAESPDEGALVSAARDLGYELVDRTSDTISIIIHPNRVHRPAVRAGSGDAAATGATAALAPRRSFAAAASVGGAAASHPMFVPSPLSASSGGIVAGTGASSTVRPHSPGGMLSVARTEQRLSFRRLGTHKFNSTRKRMSVVVEDPRDGTTWLLCKGADNVMFERARISAGDLRRLNEDLTMFSETGLRTLVLGRRQLTLEETTHWHREYMAAMNAVGRKEQALADVAEQFEVDLEIVGATAIEDRLQEGVPDTIADLACAGIKTWVLTGDKIETAINIGRTCRLITDPMGEPYRIAGETRADVLREILHAAAELDEIERSLPTGARVTKSNVAIVRTPSDPVGHLVPATGAAPAAVVNAATATGAPGNGHAAGSVGSVPNVLGASTSLNPTVDVKPITGSAARWDPSLTGTARPQPRGFKGAGEAVVESTSARGPPASTTAEADAEVGLFGSLVACGKTEENFRAMPRLERALVVTGSALNFIIRAGKDPITKRLIPRDVEMERAFLRVAMRCQAVIACRVSPKQKADIVALVRGSSTPRPMTLAIGDGANDVGMIQKAQIGVGISGREGLQAANASDFAIAQFRFLKRLLLVHGRWSYVRMSRVLLYSFYKNVVITVTLFLYNIYTGFSGTALYESMVYSVFNFALGLPIVAVGVLERDLSEDTMLRHPITYISGLRHQDLNVPRMARWIVWAVVHGLLVFYLSYGTFAGDGGPVWDPVNGITDGKEAAGLVVYCSLIWAMQAKVSLVITTWTGVHWFLIGLSQFGFYIFLLGYNAMQSLSPDFFGVALNTFARPTYWFTWILVMTALLVVDLTLEWARLQFFPTAIDIARERDMDPKSWLSQWGDEPLPARASANTKPTHGTAVTVTPGFPPGGAVGVGALGGPSGGGMSPQGPRGLPSSGPPAVGLPASVDNPLGVVRTRSPSDRTGSFSTEELSDSSNKQPRRP